MDCIFCSIIAGDIPSRKIYEDEFVFAFLDNQPWSAGHTLIVPKKHFTDLQDIDATYLAHVTTTAQKLAASYADKLDTDGFNLLQSSGSAAQQEVFHFHLHLIPRYKDDSMRIVARDISEDIDSDAAFAKIEMS